MQEEALMSFLTIDLCQSHCNRKLGYA